MHLIRQCKIFVCTLKGLRNGVNIRWGLFMPSGSAMKAVAKLVDEGKVMRCQLLWLFCKLALLLCIVFLWICLYQQHTAPSVGLICQFSIVNSVSLGQEHTVCDTLVYQLATLCSSLYRQDKLGGF